MLATVSPPSSSPSTFLPHPLCFHLPIHSSSISVQERSGLPWILTKQDISSCRKTKYLTMY